MHIFHIRCKCLDDERPEQNMESIYFIYAQRPQK